MAKRVTTNPEFLAIHSLLTKHVVKVSPDACRYEGDWNDEKIAKQVSSDLNAGHVAGIRREFFGNFSSRSEGGRGAASDLASIDSRLIAAEALLEEMTGKYNRLIDNLCLNKIADVKHLKVKVEAAPTLPLGDGK